MVFLTLLRKVSSALATHPARDCYDGPLCMRSNHTISAVREAF
jgi:hypothetical protein